MNMSALRHCLLVLLAGLPGIALASPCEDIFIKRATLVRDVQAREPVGDAVRRITGDDYALYAFTEVHGAAGETLVHHWLHDNQVAAEVRLVIGGDRWRTWSSKRLGLRRDNNWRVEIRHSSGCLLTALSPGMGQMAQQQAAQIEALLQQGDIAGARLALRDARDGMLPESLVADLEQRHLPMAQARQLIEEGNLYIARARLQSLRSRWPDDAAIGDLENRLEDAFRQRAREFAVALGALERFLEKLPVGAGLCQDSLEQLWWEDALPAMNAQLVGRVPQDGRVNLMVLDSASGATAEIRAPCLE